MQAAPAEVGMRLDEVDTPALVVDLDLLDRNLESMAGAVAGKARLRPHAKTHKSPLIARRQIALGAVGVCCQKVSEAEALVEGGVENVLVTNQVVGARKLARAADLARRAQIGICVDDAGNVAAAGNAAARAGVVLDTLVEIDVGAGRCGVRRVEDAVDLARRIEAHPALRFAGLQAYHGRAQHLRTLVEREAAIGNAAAIARAAVEALLAVGIACRTVGGAGTGSFPLEIGAGVWNELQPGSYAFMDADYGAVERHPESPTFAQSLFILTTVMSAPEPGLAICDAGLKSFSVDSGLPRLASHPDVALRGASDEHGVIPVPPGLDPKVGDRLSLIPSHCDPTVNLHDWYVGVRGGIVEAVWPVAGRGAIF